MEGTKTEHLYPVYLEIQSQFTECIYLRQNRATHYLCREHVRYVSHLLGHLLCTFKKIKQWQVKVSL